MKSIKVQIWVIVLMWVLVFFFLSTILSMTESLQDFLNLFLTKRFLVNLIIGVFMGFVIVKFSRSNN